MFRFVKKVKPYITTYTKQLIIFSIIVIVTLILNIKNVFWTVDLMNLDSNAPIIKIAIIVGGVAISGLLIDIFSFSSSMILDFVTVNMFQRIREDIYKHINNMRVDFAKENIEGDFLTRWAEDLPETQGIFIGSLTDMLELPIFTLVYTIYLMCNNLKLFLVSFLPFIIIIAVSNKYGKYVEVKLGENMKEQTILNNMIKDSAVCIQIVKIYMLFKRLKDKFKGVNDRLYKIHKDIVKKYTMSSVILNLLTFDIGGVICYVYGGYLCYNGNIGLADLFTFKFIFSSLTDCVSSFVGIIASFRSDIFYLNRVFDIFDYKVENIGNDRLIDIEYNNHIELRNVSFSYDETNILKNCSFAIKKGEKVAIAGENCKTTILNLMCGFYKPNSGDIIICGYNTDEKNLQYIRNKISIVEQIPMIFFGSIKENIICEYQYNKDRFQNAVTKSLASDFVKRFPNEYNTIINGQVGILSGGQCQRVNIARALYKDSEIMLLDNYTSALDNATKREIYKNINAIKDRTIVVFSNNVYDLEQVDRVILIKDGEVYKQGKHDDILKECEYYQKILNKTKGDEQ